MGGTLFMGRTCSAFTAGVMAIGLRAGEIEDSRLRVIRLLAIMTVGGDAFDDRLNKFNPSMNRGYRLSKWFASEFGSTQCRKITGCDFSDPKGVSDYVEGDRITKCRAIGCRVAEQVQLMLARDRAADAMSVRPTRSIRVPAGVPAGVLATITMDVAMVAAERLGGSAFTSDRLGPDMIGRWAAGLAARPVAPR